MRSFQEVAKEVLAIETESVKYLISRIDQKFDHAVELLFNCEGRVILVGMGKCGIIGHKISATLASTGTPSITVHPADAIHGDLGMITSKDVIVLISNSGETDEILALIPLLKKIGNKTVALTGNVDSTLASQSDIVLDVSVEREACPFNLAPTASTTAQLAMGDALAIALLQYREFTPEKYALLHPGGSLGRKLLKVENVMRTGSHLAKVTADAKVHDVIVLLTKTRNGAAVVVDENDFVIGFFSDGDFRRAILADSKAIEAQVGTVMTPNPTCIVRGHLATEAINLMRSSKFKISQLPVVDSDGKLLGLLDDDELLNL